MSASAPGLRVALPDHAVVDPSAWSSAALAADESWIHELGAGELAELDAAARQASTSATGTPAFVREDFPLPTLAPRLARIAHELEHGRGCALIRGLDVEKRDLAFAKVLYWGIAVHLGVPISQNARGEVIAHVADGGRSYDDKNVRGYTTRARLRPHCDACDVVGLLCWRAARAGGESLMTSSTAIFNELLAASPELLPPLIEGFHYDLRGEGATGDPDEVTRNRVPVFSWHAGRLSCRFNQKSIEDGMKKAGLALDERARQALQRVGELALSDRLRYDLTFRQIGFRLKVDSFSVDHADKGAG